MYVLNNRYTVPKRSESRLATEREPENNDRSLKYKYETEENNS